MVHLYLKPSPFTLKAKPPYDFRSNAGVKFLVRTYSTHTVLNANCMHDHAGITKDIMPTCCLQRYAPPGF